MVKVGEYNNLRIDREVDFACISTMEKTEYMLPKRFVPKGAKPGDELKVFVYHDSENRLIATSIGNQKVL